MSVNLLELILGGGLERRDVLYCSREVGNSRLKKKVTAFIPLVQFSAHCFFLLVEKNSR